MEVIATYHEERIDGSRDFQLYADRIVIQAYTTRGNPSGTASVPLKLLDPNPATLISRHRIYNDSMKSAGIGVLGVVAAVILSRSAHPGMVTLLFAVSGFWVVRGAWYIGKTHKPLHIIQFVTDARTVGIDICQPSQPDSGAYDKFIASISENIRRSREVTAVTAMADISKPPTSV